MLSLHAKERVKQRYRDNNSIDAVKEMRLAYERGNYLAVKNQDKRRVTVYFSENKSFLWKVVLSKKDGSMITVLPVTSYDIDFAIEKGVIKPRG